MKILITGATGFVGSHLIDYVLANHPDVEIYGTRRWRSPLENISHCIDKINLIDCDMGDLSSLISIFEHIEFDKVFHLAAQSFVPFSYKAPEDTLRTNVIGTSNLLQAILFSEQDPLIHICSSSEVYGQVKESDLPLKESQPLNPVSPYGVSKVGEDMLGLMYYKAYGLKTVRTRMFTHTGPRQHEALVCSSIAKQIAMIEKGKAQVVMLGNVDSVRTLADVRDTVRAYWMLREDMTGEVYNIGGKFYCSILGLLGAFQQITGWSIPHETDVKRMRPADVTLQIPDNTKFFNATGWEATIPIERTLTDLLDDWRERV